MTQSAPKRQNSLICTTGDDNAYYTSFKVDNICIQYLGNILINLYPNL